MIKNMKHPFGAVAAISAALLLGAQGAEAQTSPVPYAAQTMGCMLYESGKLRFAANQPSKKEQVWAVVKQRQSALIRRSGYTPVLHPCLTGNAGNTSAQTYAALAARYPKIFEPLPPVSQSVIPAGKGNEGAKSYRYVGVEGLLPSNLIAFFPSAIVNRGTAYGQVFDSEFNFYGAAIQSGGVRILHDNDWTWSLVNTANDQGVAGGTLFRMTASGELEVRGALFNNGKVEVIQPVDGDNYSEVFLLNNQGQALILSCGQDCKFAIVKNGRPIALDFGPDIGFPSFLAMNDRGIISGTAFIADIGFRGFRFDPENGKVTILDPLPTEPDSWAMGINNSGDVLGYSFVISGIERIGNWDAEGRFHTYFVEGPDATGSAGTISNRLRFNDNNLIAISDVTCCGVDVGNSFLVPKPGSRINLAELVKDTPEEHGPLSFIMGINNLGNLIGSTGNFNSFLLEHNSEGN